MKNLIVVLVVAVGSLFTVNAQKSHNIIALEQTKGEFTQKKITVDEGTYVFEIANNAVGHDVGFVLVKKGEDITKPENHIKTAYVTKAVATGDKQTSNPTTLEKGEYIYFCPLNPTSTDNVLIVK
ncbi:plastocyanin/azurin family copper-binding protein [Cellulophaga tyrosinoxydans]|uniref:Cupredoxin-like domain-containing protein n=1 Tax=Cellulophaga tyrosinoxydans TaxID=504486 RepID=A0A1W1Z2D6_9FLAO|nr:plastocyanin/azurin family copper-binding protein [Cellulophaga tyrosinoxydans]SMC42108.1 Cupredoxin-like domain-containing protein [Cellulophaga tyrosinoxydans]